MATASRKDKLSIAAMLYLATKDSLYLHLIGVVGYLLKLVKSNDTRTVGTLKIFKNLVQGSLGIGNVANTDIQCRCYRYRVKLHTDQQRPHHLKETFTPLGGQRLELLIDTFAKKVDKLGKRPSAVNINEECMIVVQVRLGKCMLNQPRLTHTAWRNQCHIATIGQMLDKSGCLLLPVTKIGGRNIFAYYKRIV